MSKLLLHCNLSLDVVKLEDVSITVDVTVVVIVVDVVIKLAVSVSSVTVLPVL